MARHLHRAGVDWRCEGDFAANACPRGQRRRFDGGAEVPASASPPVVPHRALAAAVDPEEAFVAALFACHVPWFLDLAGRDGPEVAACRDLAEGGMRRTDRGRRAIATVTVRPEVTFRAAPLPGGERLTALHGRAHEACVIATSVTSEIVVDPLPARLPAPDTEESA